ncbi:hypothetical protein [Streptomyces turgidiscabies]|uniref:hypothetical protein n=1 Tax=Streptomyces turgidiscabies TaxID=85558 RepID=UPI0038F6FB4B
MRRDCVPDLGPAHCHLCSEMTGRDEVYPGPHCPTRAVEAATVAFEVAAGYEQGLTVDRVNVDGPYSPDNGR